VLQREFTLIQDELNHNTWNKCQSDCGHKDEIVCCSCLLNVLEFLVDRVRCGSHIEVELWISCCNSENGLIHVLRVQSCDILRSDVKEVDDIVQVFRFVRLVNLVGAISVRIDRTLVAERVDGIIEVSVVLDVNVGNFES